MPFFEVPAILGKGLWPIGCHSADCFDPLLRRPNPEVRFALIEALSNLTRHYLFVWIPLSILKRRIERAHFSNREILPFSLVRMLSENQRTTFRHSSFGDYLAFVSGYKSRKTLRRKYRRLKGIEHLEFTLHRSMEEVRGILPHLESIEIASWKGRTGMGLFNRPELRSFYARLLPRLAGQGNAEIATLDLNDHP